MGKFALIQAAYCITGILFFVRDLYARVPMGKAIVNAFLWPYAQWQIMKEKVLAWVSMGLSLIQ